ncbi:hypothetical protein ES703_116268 [subsurface metagenome]
MPTTFSPNPSANRISVLAGAIEIILSGCLRIVTSLLRSSVIVKGNSLARETRLIPMNIADSRIPIDINDVHFNLFFFIIFSPLRFDLNIFLSSIYSVNYAHSEQGPSPVCVRIRIGRLVIANGVKQSRLHRSR